MEARIELRHRSRQSDARVALLATAALVVVGPLRGAFEASPLVPFPGALVLFMAPGMLLSHWLLNDRFSGAALTPVSFAR